MRVAQSVGQLAGTTLRLGSGSIGPSNIIGRCDSIVRDVGLWYPNFRYVPPAVALWRRAFQIILRLMIPSVELDFMGRFQSTPNRTKAGIPTRNAAVVAAATLGLGLNVRNAVSHGVKTLLRRQRLRASMLRELLTVEDEVKARIMTRHRLENKQELTLRLVDRCT